MPVTLSQVRAWTTEHLVNAASYWSKTADQWEDVFLQMRNQSYSITWKGAGGDGLRQRTGADLSVVSGKADQLRKAAGIARNGASDIGAAQRRVLYAVEDAQNAGFTVGEDLSVTDTRSGTTPADHAARQARAEAFAGDIRARAEQLEGVDRKVARELTTTTADLGTVGTVASSGRDDVQPVDAVAGLPPDIPDRIHVVCIEHARGMPWEFECLVAYPDGTTDIYHTDEDESGIFP
ncbi:hypothetical protein BB737_02100 [Mycobacterium avium subsp. hominissuis]|nr:hypothetical protein BEP52_16020 [Mycobacterium avium subsp. hominissuis]ETA99844.1 hypothetical protein O982_05520 [Mycobacterium avium 10-5581]BAN32126.1 hypothetical protein MAH_3052 [Mycobacterium avium subsp. hominissuis TH135]ATO72710.1 hypothetical protein BJP74_15705 [Mycobacterium avium subsp. hominissuis]PBJ28856.1 hypothetical protein BI294_25860 [Mycobacterium avium subsp. hominissuis]